MKRKLLIGLAPLLALVAVAAAPAIAQAEVKELVSGESNSLCVNPVELTLGASPHTGKYTERKHYRWLTKAHRGGPLPDTGSACAAGYSPHALDVPADVISHERLPGTSWVSYNSAGEDGTNPPPRYYIYDEQFELCSSQVHDTTIEGKMLADDIAGAFLNGKPIGHDTIPETGHGTNAGIPAPFSSSSDFQTGLNTLQLVVYDEYGAEPGKPEGHTGLDFAATVTSEASCTEPQWYSDGELLPEKQVAQTISWGTLTFSPAGASGGEIEEGQQEHVTTSGTLALSFVVDESEVQCTVSDEETIENPTGGGAGTDEITAIDFSNCFIPPTRRGGGGNAPVCGSELPEVTASGLPWPASLISGSREEISGIELEVKCPDGVYDEVDKGTLTPTLSNSVLTFERGSGELTQGSYGTTPVTGTDTLTGPAGDEVITATNSTPPHWYSGTGEGAAGAPTVTCKKSDAGNIWNEGGIGHDETVLFDLYECRSKECSKGVGVTASGLPWQTQLAEEPRGSEMIFDKITGIVLTIACEGREYTFAGELSPKWVNRKGTASPSFDEFSAASGQLASESKEVSNLVVSGDDKVLGFEEGDEEITAKGAAGEKCKKCKPKK